MKLLPLPAFTDNYIWMLHDGTHAVVVDPGDATPVQHALQSLGLSLQAILGRVENQRELITPAAR